MPSYEAAMGTQGTQQENPFVLNIPTCWVCVVDTETLPSCQPRLSKLHRLGVQTGETRIPDLETQSPY